MSSSGEMSAAAVDEGVVRRCPLCGEVAGATLTDVRFEQIWDALEQIWGLHASAELKAKHTPAPSCQLRLCDGCGLRYFTPSVPGDGAFYEALAGAGYYEVDRWEFRVVAELLTPGDSLLDVGCGDGAFLRCVAPGLGRAVGIDRNQHAIGRLSASGIEAYPTGLAEFAEAHTGVFSVVCAFQTLEHLGSIDSIIQPALRCLTPGGRLFLSVPNDERAIRQDFEPLDHPPHHISRWRSSQWRHLAKRYSLELVCVRCEPPDLLMYRELTERSARQTASRILGQRCGELIGRVAWRLSATERRHAQLLRRDEFAMHGIVAHTQLAEFRVPTARS